MRKITLVIVCLMLITMLSFIFPVKILTADPPNVPYDPDPTDNSTNVSIYANLNWSCEDPDGDQVTYDVYFGTVNRPDRVQQNLSVSFYDPPVDLDYSTLYFWQIVAWDNHSNSTSGPIWSFTTQQEPGYTLTTTTIGSGSVQKIPDQASYHIGDTVELTAFASPGWTFVAWSGNLTGSANPDIITITGNMTVFASFTENPPTNNPPVANAGPDQMVLVTTTVLLNGSGSSDLDGDPLTYMWSFVSRPFGSTAVLSDFTIVNPTFVADTSGSYIVQLIVNDGLINSTPDTVVIDTANEPPNIPSSPLPANGSIGISVNVDLSWIGGDPDPGDMVNFDVFFGTSNPPQKKINNQTTTSYDPGTMSYSTTYYWKIVAWDSHNNSSTSGLFHFTTAAKPSGGGEPPQPPQNIKPIADASARAPYQGYINSTILFDGSRSRDPDGNITSWFWDFDDNTYADGMIVYHTFFKAATYTVRLTVTDDSKGKNNVTITCVIKQPNRPPTKPQIDGPTSGTKNTMYAYTAKSTDLDNDLLQYTFDWGDSVVQPSGFVPNATNYTGNHSWSEAGRYNVTVTATDNRTETSSKLNVYINAIQTRGAGYLLDNDGDGIYDTFYSDETHQTVSIQRNDDSYLIDKDGDGTWEYVYNATSGLTSYQEPRTTPGFELVLTCCAISLIILLIRKRKTI